MSLSNGAGFEGMKLAKQISTIILGLGLASPVYATEIINNVSSSASTGGNSVTPGGEIIQGESKASVKIYTEVDGEVITDIDETVDTTEIQGKTLQSGKALEEKNNVIIAFLNKIFNYVLSIFS